MIAWSRTAALVVLVASPLARAEAPHAVAPADSYPRIVESQGRICEEDLDASGCVVDRCRNAGQRRDPSGLGSVVGPGPKAEHPEACKAGVIEVMPAHAQSDAAETVEAPPPPEPPRDWGGKPGEPLRLIQDTKPRYVEGAEHEALFLARTQAKTGAAQGWSLPLKFIAVGGAAALPFLVADAASVASTPGGNAGPVAASILVDVVVAGLCAGIAVVVDNSAKAEVEREAADAKLPGAQASGSSRYGE